MSAPLAALPEQVGVTEAARLLGIPEVTFRLHIDQGKVLGTYRNAKGYRKVNREGLLAYARARKLESPAVWGSDRRRDLRVQGNQAGVDLRYHEPETERLLAEGKGGLEDLSLSGLRASRIRWQGPMPGTKGRFSYEVTEGPLRGAKGDARAAWMVCREGTLSLGLSRGAGSGPWEAHVETEIQRRRDADLAYAQSFDNPWAHARQRRSVRSS